MDTLLALFRAMADPTRLRIMRLIQAMELSISELALVLEQSQPRVSRHVRILAESRLIERYREGAWVFLRPAHNGAARAVGTLLAGGLADDAPQFSADQGRLAAVRAAREAAARGWFEAHAEAWDGIRSLHVPEAAVEADMLRLLDTAGYGDVLDVGTGTGRIAELLAPCADHLVALDSSPAMLRVARARLGGLATGRGRAVELMLGDFNALPLADALFDTVVFHQVLHFALAPERAIGEAARVLRPGGRLMIVDFAPHAREDLRRDHAHARLGFDDDAIRRWMLAAALRLAHVAALDGGELGVRIWVGRKAEVAGIGTAPQARHAA